MEQVYITFESEEAKEKLLANKEFLTAMNKLVELALDMNSRVLPEVKPEIAVNHIKNWKVYHSNSSDTGIVLNYPKVGDESVCIQNIETGEFKYLILNR